MGLSEAISRPENYFSRPPEAISHPENHFSRPPEAISHPEKYISRPAEAVFRPAEAISRPAEAISRPAACFCNLYFGNMEGVLVLAAVAQQYKLRLKSDFKLELDPHVTLRPKHGLPMVVETR